MMTTIVDRRGFTLLELMVVVLIIGVLASIALPAYNRYTRTSARAEAQSQMLKVAGDLERWRAKNLSYAGFTPEGGFTTGTITTATGAVMYVPKGSTSTNFKYQLALLDDAMKADLSKRRYLSLTTTSTATAGQNWVIIGQPNTANTNLNRASRLVLSSQGVRCMTDTILSDDVLKSNITNKDINDNGLCVNNSKAW